VRAVRHALAKWQGWLQVSLHGIGGRREVERMIWHESNIARVAGSCWATQSMEDEENILHGKRGNSVQWLTR